MAYMLLILEESAEKERWAPDVGRERYERMMAFAGDLQARGVLLAADSLGSDATGVRIRRQGGNASLVDGPFAEAKEVVGGFFLVDCASREEAVAIARQCPAAEWSTVEVRMTGPCFDRAG